MDSIRDMYDSGEWMDVTTVGSSFVVELNQRTGQYRHRPRHFFAEHIEEDWRYGQPKEGTWQK